MPRLSPQVVRSDATTVECAPAGGSGADRSGCGSGQRRWLRLPVRAQRAEGAAQARQRVLRPRSRGRRRRRRRQHVGHGQAVGIIGAAGHRNVVAADIGRIVVDLTWAAAATSAALPVCRPLIMASTSAPSVLLGSQFVVEARLEDAALRQVEIGAFFSNVCSWLISDWIACASRPPTSCDRLLAQRIACAMKFAQKFVCASLSRYLGVGFSASGNRREAGNAALTGHVGQIGVALDDVDHVKDIVVAGAARVRTDAGLVDVSDFELRLPHHRVGVNAGQAAEQHRVAPESASWRSVMTAFMSSVMIAWLSALTPPRMRLAASLKMAPISARLACGAVAAVTPSASVAGVARNPVAPFCVARPCSVAIGIDDVENVEMAGAQRGLRRRDAAERAAAVHRGGRRRQRSRDVGQDGLHMGQRVAGELSGGDFRLQGRSAHAVRSLT